MGTLDRELSCTCSVLAPMTIVMNMIRNTTEGLQTIYAPIHEELEQTECLLRDQFQSDFAFIDRLAQQGLRLAGKRLRPALVLLTGAACGVLTPKHQTMAAVVEMIHTATLVHDDVLDEASVRRHTQTINTLFDNETAVLFGDYLLAKAIRLAMSVDEDEVPQILTEATQAVVEGELRQVGNRGNYALSETEYEAIIRGKTAALCRCCTQLGATLSGVPPELVGLFADYAEALGMAFQIADDMLDLRGSEAEVGKSLGTDIEKRKTTLPLIHLLRRATPEDLQKIHALLENPTVQTRTELLPWFHRYESGPYASARAAAFITKANDSLDQILRNSEVVIQREAIESLRQLAGFTVSRRH